MITTQGVSFHKFIFFYLKVMKRVRSSSGEISMGGMTHSASFVRRVESALSMNSQSIPRIDSTASLGSIPDSSSIPRVDSLTFLANAVLEGGNLKGVEGGNGNNGDSKRKAIVKSPSGTGLSFYMVSSQTQIKQEKTMKNSLSSSASIGNQNGIDLLESATTSGVGNENDSNFAVGLPLGGFGNSGTDSPVKIQPVIPVPLAIGTVKSNKSLSSLLNPDVSPSTISSPNATSAQKRKRQRRSKEESKAKHRMVERKRTKRLNELISALKMEVMDEETRNDKKKSDKVSVLMKSLETIRVLKAQLRKYKQAGMQI